MDRKERFNEAYTYIKGQGTIRTQGDLAKSMSTTQPNVSSALKGVEAVLTDNFLRRFNEACGDVFQINWLLTGEGEMLRTQPSAPQPVPYTQNNEGCEQVTQNGDINVISAEIIGKALNEVSEMRKALTKALEKNQQNTDRFLAIIEKISNK